MSLSEMHKLGPQPRSSEPESIHMYIKVWKIIKSVLKDEIMWIITFKKQYHIPWVNGYPYFYGGINIS